MLCYSRCQKKCKAVNRILESWVPASAKVSYVRDGRVFSMLFEFWNVSLNEFFSKSWVINTPRDNSRFAFEFELAARYVAHFFNCSPLNDETIAQAEKKKTSLRNSNHTQGQISNFRSKIRFWINLLKSLIWIFALKIRSFKD